MVLSLSGLFLPLTTCLSFRCFVSTAVVAWDAAKWYLGPAVPNLTDWTSLKAVPGLGERCVYGAATLLIAETIDAVAGSMLCLALNTCVGYLSLNTRL